MIGFRASSLVRRLVAIALALVLALSSAPLAWAEEPTEMDAVLASAVEAASQKASSVVLDEEKNAINENQMPDTSFIYDSTIEELASADSYYDKQTVQVVGEATGDIINDEFGSGYCWVMLWEEGTAATNAKNASNTANTNTVRVTNTLTVHMSAEDAALIDTLGSYSRKGTTLQVRGVFNLVCSEHNGISDLHATYVSVTKRGGAATHAVGFGMFVPGILLLALGGALFFLFNRIREKMR